MIGDNNLLILDVSEISAEDVIILQKAIDVINKNKIKLKAKWVEDWDNFVESE